MFTQFSFCTQNQRTSFVTSLLILACSFASAQLIINDSNVSQQKEKKYIQFMYYVEKGTLKPVYYIDHGVTEVDVAERQTIKIDGMEIVGDMSPMLVLNLLYKNGWEYMGDMHYQRQPMSDNFFIYTLKRRDSMEASAHHKSH